MLGDLSESIQLVNRGAWPSWISVDHYYPGVQSEMEFEGPFIVSLLNMQAGTCTVHHWEAPYCGF